MDDDDDPKLKSNFAKTVYENLKHQKEHESDKHPYWYTMRLDLVSPAMAQCFIHMNQDEETTQFLQHCFAKGNWVFTQMYHALAKSVLTFFMTATSANGLLHRGSMFVFSTDQFKRLLNLPEDYRGEFLLDLGAGDGNVTQRMAPFFNEVHVTEISPVMRRRLKKCSFKVLPVEEWEVGDIQYDVIACLNLLDRCDSPLTLLSKIRTKLKPGSGCLLLAIVLPLKQFVEVNSNNQASEVLEVSSSRVPEAQLMSFVHHVLSPCGFNVVNWTRLPYICEGDLSHSFYTLSDYVLLLKPS